MAKAAKQEMSDEVRNASVEGIGQDSFGDLQGKIADFDAFENIPTFVPGKNLEEGMTLKGKFKLTKRVYSEKFTAGKKDEITGRKYRDLHVLTDAKLRTFGIWSVGKLAATMKHLVPGDYLEITYEGKDAESLRPGESPAHDFTIRGVGVNGMPLVADNNAEDEIPAALLNQNARLDSPRAAV